MSQVDITNILALPEDGPRLYVRLPHQRRPQRVYIVMSRTGVLAHAYDADVESMDVWNRLTLKLFEVPESVNVEALKVFVKEHLDLIQKIHDGHVVSYDNGSPRGTLTDEAEDALDTLRVAAEKYCFPSWFVIRPDEYLATVRDDQIREDVKKYGDVLKTAQEYLKDERLEPDLWIEGGGDALAEEIERRMQDMEEEEYEEEDEEEDEDEED